MPNRIETAHFQVGCQLHPLCFFVFHNWSKLFQNSAEQSRISWRGHKTYLSANKSKTRKTNPIRWVALLFRCIQSLGLFWHRWHPFVCINIQPDSRMSWIADIACQLNQFLLLLNRKLICFSQTFASIQNTSGLQARARPFWSMLCNFAHHWPLIQWSFGILQLSSSSNHLERLTLTSLMHFDWFIHFSIYCIHHYPFCYFPNETIVTLLHLQTLFGLIG